MNYVFIGGCPRSGTSILTELLSSHPEITIGMERYKRLYAKRKVTRDLFAEEHFFAFNEEETNITNTGKYAQHYAESKRKFTHCKWVGDKYPHLVKQIPVLHREFGGQARFFVIIRNIDDVASSFNVRAANKKDSWPAENNYERAVDIWNKTMEYTLKAIKKDIPLHIVKYEELLDSECFDTDSCRASLLRFLELNDESNIASAHKVICEDYIKKIKYKEKTVLENQMEFINQHTDRDLHETLLLEYQHRQPSEFYQPVKRAG